MNKKKLIPLLGLAAVVAVLGVALALLTGQPADTEETAGVALFPDLDSGTVTSVHYIATGETATEVTLTRPSTAEDAVWTVTEDKKLPIDQGSAAAVAADVAGMTAARELSGVSVSADMGFDAPSYTFDFMAGDTRYGFTVGAKNTMTDAYYAQVEGSDAVYTIKADDLSSLCKTPKELYAAQSVTTLAVDQVTEMTVDNGAAAFRFTKNDDGDWILADDTGYALNQDTVGRMASTLCGLQSQWTITDPEADSAYGLAAPDVTVTLTAEDGTTVKAAFGTTDPADSTLCYLAGSEQPGVVLEVAAENLSAYTFTKETLMASTAETAESGEDTTAQYPVS